ncbi:MAG: hypothetical protein Q8O15_08400 [Rectinemataceae bacterium]|nr:hypothetical protein [Rectinemataceae bacterium]
MVDQRCIPSIVPAGVLANGKPARTMAANHAMVGKRSLPRYFD